MTKKVYPKKNLSRTCFLRLSTVSTQKRLHIWQKRFGMECLATFGDTTLGQQGHAVTCRVQLLKIYSIVLAMRCPETKSPLIISPLTRRLLTKCLQTVIILFTCLPSLRCTQTRGAITKYQFANCQMIRSLFTNNVFQRGNSQQVHPYWSVSWPFETSDSFQLSFDRMWRRQRIVSK